MIYLDTSIIVWLYQGNRRKFSKKAIRLLDSHEKYVSPIVMLELAYLNEIGRVIVPATEIIQELQEVIYLKICSHPFYKVIERGLHMSWTRDPFDRVIAAQAALHANPLLTKDETILKNYSHAVWD